MYIILLNSENQNDFYVQNCVAMKEKKEIVENRKVTTGRNMKMWGFCYFLVKGDQSGGSGLEKRHYEKE